jgi:hypothetical protein
VDSYNILCQLEGFAYSIWWLVLSDSIWCSVLSCKTYEDTVLLQAGSHGILIPTL